MPFMEWSDSLSVGHADIDGDHKRLVQMVNDLHNAMMERQGAKIVGGVLNDLIDYTKTHFSREETLMKASAYPQYLAHKTEHDKLLKQAGELNKRFQAGEVSVTLDTMDFLRNWLLNHIMKADRQLGEWAQTQPV